MSSPSSDDRHVQLEFPTLSNHHSSWSRDGLRTLDQLTKSPPTPNELPNWSRPRHPPSPPLLTVSRSSPEESTEADHEILCQRFLSQMDVPSGAQRIHTSTLYLDDSDADADDERPRTPLTDNFSENDSNDHECVSGDCAAGLIGSQSTELMEPNGVYAVPPSLTRSTRIRFHSRVRITSGLNRHRHSSITSVQSRENAVRLTNDDGGYFYFTPSSSISGSPSSSISAPLRSRTDDEADRPGWGPLGQRVNMFANRNRVNKQGGKQLWGKPARAEDQATRTGTAETSPLLIPPPRIQDGRLREQHRMGRCYCSRCGLSSQKTLSPEDVDETFGKWPNRILNYQWWWWHAEAVICCRCLDETDDLY